MSDAIPEWTPVWRLKGEALVKHRRDRERYDVCKPCFDVGLPCYHREPHELGGVIVLLRRHGETPQ